MINFKNIRNKNIEILINKQYKINYNLPLLETNKVRNINEVLNRINILHIFYAIYLEGSESIIFFKNLINDNNWNKYLTKKEIFLLNKKKISSNDLIQISWFKESIYVLIWSIGLVKNEDLYNNLDEIDLSNYYNLIPPENEYELFLNNSLLNEEDFYKLLDYYYLLNWSIKSEKAPFFFKSKYNNRLSLVMERRKALEWLCDSSLDFDNIILDT
jgi:hypothetical protein